MMVGLDLATDVLLAVLLVAVIIYAVILNRKLAALRNAKEEFEALLASFGDTTQQAQTNLESLREEAQTVKRGFDQELEQMGTSLAEVRGLADDLEYLVKRGEKVADRLATREPGKPAAAERASEPEPETATSASQGGAQQQFLRALQGMR